MHNLHYICPLQAISFWFSLTKNKKIKSEKLPQNIASVYMFGVEFFFLRSMEKLTEAVRNFNHSGLYLLYRYGLFLLCSIVYVCVGVLAVECI